MTRQNRINSLDSLKSFIILLVVVLHASAIYMKNAPEWWYVVDPQNSLFFTLLSILISVPIMAVMFFVAGYFSLKSLQKTGIQHYIKNKLIRIGIPWVIGAIVLAPITGYFIHFSRDLPMGFFHFVLYDHWVNSYQQSVYWFLGVLLLFFLILALAFNFSARLQSVRPKTSIPTWKTYLGFVVLCIASMLLVNQFVPMNSWYTGLYVVMFQPVKLPLYVSYFCLGIFAYLNNWYPIRNENLTLRYRFLFWVVAAMLYLLQRIKVLPAISDAEFIGQLSQIVLFNLYCFSSLIFGVALFQKKVNENNVFWRAMNRTSYGIYFIHIIILCPLAYMFLSFDMPLSVKASLVVFLTVLVSWAVSHWGLNRAPLLKRSFST